MSGAPHIEVTQELIKHGFRSLSFRRGVLCLRGSLRCDFGEVPVDLAIDDWDFVAYPTIRLLGRPERLRGLQPHIFARGELCYYAPGVVVLDRHDPIDAVLHCLAQATLVLNQLALNEDYRREEFTREFLAEWALGQSPTPRAMIKAGVLDGSTEVATAILSDSWMIVGSDPGELKSVAGAMGTPIREFEAYKAWIFRTSRWPPLTDRFLRTRTELSPGLNNGILNSVAPFFDG